MSFRDDRDALVSLVAAMRQRAERAEAMVETLEAQRDRLAVECDQLVAQLEEARRAPPLPPPTVPSKSSAALPATAPTLGPAGLGLPFVLACVVLGLATINVMSRH